VSTRFLRVLLVLVLALCAGTLVAPAAAAQGVGCQRTPVVGVASNVDLLVRGSGGAPTPVRLAGLQPWTDGWPLYNSLVDAVRDLVARAPLCATTDGPSVAPDGTPLLQAWLPAGQGPLALFLVSRGWAQVAPDAETTAPTLAASLRAAEADARAAGRGIWQVLNALTTYTTPTAGTFRVDASLVPAINTLAQLDVGRSLVDGLARGGVTVFVMAEPEGIWAHYDTQAKVIGIDRSLLGTDPRTLATILSHEATHALDDQSGMVTQAAQQLGQSGACYADEYQATVTEVQVWQQFWGPQGRPQAQHPYERQENRELARYLRSPQGFAARLVAEYGFECGR